MVLLQSPCKEKSYVDPTRAMCEKLPFCSSFSVLLLLLQNTICLKQLKIIIKQGSYCCNPLSLDNSIDGDTETMCGR